jgi:tRNA modification GTPase
VSGAGDTIFAPASGAGRAAITLVRVSGRQTAEMVRRLAGRLPEPRVASLRRLRGADGDVLDRALVLWFPGPASYSGEDCAELHLHGGRAVLRAVAEALVALGCRPAEPGEFTRRALLNGRLDLTEAEGIADLIGAETEAQRVQALRQAEGALSRRLASWSGRIAALLAWQEAAIEFAEDGVPSDLDARARGGAAALRAEMASGLAEGARAERLRDGVAVAILGAPNAGKSSLLNALAGREAAIVSARAGTTRDVVEVAVELAGVPVVLADTAGLRETGDEIEAEGVRRALARAEAADLRLAVFAADAEPDAATLGLLGGPGTIAVVNKVDLATPGVNGAVAVSARTGAGLDALRARLAEEVAARAGLTEAAALTRPRHMAALAEAAAALAEAEAAPLPEIAAEGLRAALAAVGRITGRVGVEEILDRVFGEFCIGK